MFGKHLLREFSSPVCLMHEAFEGATSIDDGSNHLCRHPEPFVTVR